ncbi:MAG: hypothetical protein H5T84_00315, partial [Thermoleophilia bacterium]|nr:hypothetical protein [Thermoleophilia bacterium]
MTTEQPQPTIEAAGGASAVDRRVMQLNADLERYERGWYLRGDALEKLLQWADAYPVEVFPEMTSEDWKRAAEVLKAAGLSLDRISASNM